MKTGTVSMLNRVPEGRKLIGSKGSYYHVQFFVELGIFPRSRKNVS